MFLIPQLVMPTKDETKGDGISAPAESPEPTPEAPKAPEAKPATAKSTKTKKAESGHVNMQNPKGRVVSIPEEDVERHVAMGFKKA